MRKVLAEALGTALLLAVVIGSGVMAERLSGGNGAVTLLANALATTGGLYVLIEMFGPISGAHFNPAVSLVMAGRGRLAWSQLGPYVVAQLAGALLGAMLAHAMFDMTAVQFSTRARTGAGQWIAEVVATFGLLLVILRAPASRVAAMVAAYIGAAYWFTASTSFANPAAAFGRMFSDTYAGIAPSSVGRLRRLRAGRCGPGGRRERALQCSTGRCGSGRRTVRRPRPLRWRRCTTRDPQRHAGRRRGHRGHLRAHRPGHHHLVRVGAAGRRGDARAHREDARGASVARVGGPGRCGRRLRVRGQASRPAFVPVVGQHIGVHPRRLARAGRRQASLRGAVRAARGLRVLPGLRGHRAAQRGQRWPCTNPSDSRRSVSTSVSATSMARGATSAGGSASCNPPARAPARPAPRIPGIPDPG
jgi:glycerol uptake facilitator-like aquaporin